MPKLRDIVYHLYWARGFVKDQIATWPPFLRVPEIAHALGREPSTIAHRCHQADIPAARRPGGGFLIPKAWLPVYANEWPEAPLGDLLRASLACVENGILKEFPALLTIAETTRLLRIGPPAVKTLLAQKAITGRFIFTHWQITTVSILEAMEQDRLVPVAARQPSRIYGKRRQDHGKGEDVGVTLTAKEAAWLLDFVPGGLLRLLGAGAGPNDV